MRGYAHLGALRACEDRGIELCGVAGTSIGAIVAALVAVGYTSRDLYDIDDAGMESGLFSIDLVKALFDRREYRRLERFGRWWRAAGAGGDAARGRAAAFAQTRIGYALAVANDLRRRVSRENLEFALAQAPVPLSAALVFALPHWAFLRSIWARSGVLDGSVLTEWLNELLCVRLDRPAGIRITFSDVETPLVLVAANLSTARMTVFDTVSHGDTSVAEAAVASAAYPFVFKPRRIGDEVFIDGGIVSNFPAWALDATRASRDDALPTIGFRIADAPRPTAPDWPKGRHPQAVEVARRLFTTAAFGRGDLESRRIEALHPIAVETSVKATDFHLVMEARSRLYSDGVEKVRAYFSEELGPKDPAAMELRLRGIVDIVRAITSAEGRIRCYLIQPVDARFARVVYTAFHGDDTDDALVMRRSCESQALSFIRREPILMRTSEIGERQRRSSATKYLHALRSDRISHIYSVPMFASAAEWSKKNPSSRTEPVAALCVDFESADDHLLLEADREDVLAALADAFVGFWRDATYVGLDDLGSDLDQRPAGDWTALTGMDGLYVSSRKVRKRPIKAMQDQIKRATA